MRNTQKRYYSPRFSELAAVSVRRFAWAVGKPMPAAVDLMVRLLPSIVDTSKVCQSCKDNIRCQVCTFGNQVSAREQTVLLSAL